MADIWWEGSEDIHAEMLLRLYQADLGLHSLTLTLIPLEGLIKFNRILSTVPVSVESFVSGSL